MAPAKSPKPRVLIAGLVVGALVIGASFALGRLSAPVASAPSTTSAEAGFARDMRVHHLQAVDMSMIVRDETDDEDLRLLAYDIAMTQQSQAGQMLGWLAEWRLPTTSPEPVMTWMARPPLTGEDTHAHAQGETAHTPGDAMPGMATPEQLQQLKQLSGVDAERLYLELMIEHHKGGVEMAEAVLARSRERVVVQLANGIVKSQTSEIEVMETMLGQLP
jgi:uncharacterized protein (DUF305 family)